MAYVENGSQIWMFQLSESIIKITRSSLHKLRYTSENVTYAWESGSTFCGWWWASRAWPSWQLEEDVAFRWRRRSDNLKLFEGVNIINVPVQIHFITRPCCHEIYVTLSWRGQSVRDKPWWLYWTLNSARQTDRPWIHLVWHREWLHMGKCRLMMPNRRLTATRIASSSSRSPHDDMGKGIQSCSHHCVCWDCRESSLLLVVARTVYRLKEWLWRLILLEWPCRSFV